VALGLSAVAGGCDGGGAHGGGDPGAVRVVDDAGREVRLVSPAARVISLVPARTEAIIALGAGDRLIARTQYDLQPSLEHLPSVGNALNPSVEWLAAQRPDLVIAWADGEARTVIDQLSAVGVAAYGTRVETLAEHDAAIADLGELLGVAPAADSLRAAISAQLDRVRRAVEGRERPRVLFLVGVETPFTTAKGTFLDEVVAIAGGDNVFHDLAQPWAQVSLEEIVRRRPEVIVVATRNPGGTTAARLRTIPGWRDVPAVRSGHVHEVDADLFTRVGPDVGTAAARLATILHPGAL
jgi:iron complex transport system substrate-binding protein